VCGVTREGKVVWDVGGVLEVVEMTRSLDTETVERSPLSLERVDDVEGGDGLALGVFGVGDRVSDDV
jgi:hypothetical protein